MSVPNFMPTIFTSPDVQSGAQERQTDSGVANKVNIKHNLITSTFGQWKTVPGVILTLKDILEYLSGII